jgi:hypothetical protein
MTEPLLTTGSHVMAEARARSARDRHEAMTALEPSEPSRGAIGRLRLAVVARSALGHPNLLRACVIGEGDGRLFVAFEPCPHRSLAELLAAAPLEPAECARLLYGAAAGVDALSRQGLVARDMTPERVLVHPAQGGVLMDLGIPPELLRALPLEQDPDLAFRSPEEFRRQPVDVRSSVYSLGVILFTALTGVPPYVGTRSDDYSSHLAGAPPRLSERRPELSPEIDAVVARAMAADPEERYATAEALSRAATAAFGAYLVASKTLSAELKPSERRRQPAQVPPQRNGRPSTTSPSTEDRPTPHPMQERPQPRPPKAGQTEAPLPNSARAPRPAKKRPPKTPLAPTPKEGRAERRSTSWAADGFAAAAQRCVALMAALLALASAAGRRGRAGLRRFAGAVGPVGRDAASMMAEATRSGARVLWGLLQRAWRLAVAAGRSLAAQAGVAAVVAGVTLHRAHTGLARLKRSTPSRVQDGGGRFPRFVRRNGKPVTGLAGSRTTPASEGRPTFFGSVPTPGRARGLASIGSAALSALSHRKLVLQAVGAIVAAALSGIALGHAVEPKGKGPSSVTRSGLTVQLPPGWEQATFDPGRLTFSSAIAAVPSGETKAGFVVGKLSSQATAERVLERVQREGDGRTQVRLGGLYAWRYAGLRPRPTLVGTGYVVPTSGGAVLLMCHASKDEARVRLTECGRAATTLVVRGDRPRQLSSVDRSRERLIRVTATLRSSRSEGRRRLEAADLAPGQVRAATSLKRAYQRAARSLDQVLALENGDSLGSLGAASRASGAAYGRLARAATRSSPSGYRKASHAVVREEAAVRRELALVSAD